MATQKSRKLFSRGEWLTLLGMALVVMSAALTWGRSAPNVLVGGSLGVVYRDEFMRNHTAYEVDLGKLKLGWVLVVGAVTCASLLLLEPTGREKRLLMAVHSAVAIGIIALAGLHFGPFPGAILALIGGAILLVAAFQRYR